MFQIPFEVSYVLLDRAQRVLFLGHVGLRLLQLCPVSRPHVGFFMFRQ